MKGKYNTDLHQEFRFSKFVEPPFLCYVDLDGQKQFQFLTGLWLFSDTLLLRKISCAIVGNRFVIACVEITPGDEV